MLLASVHVYIPPKGFRPPQMLDGAYSQCGSAPRGASSRGFSAAGVCFLIPGLEYAQLSKSFTLHLSWRAASNPLIYYDCLIASAEHMVW
ncbi:hypothetical protein BJX68DRAFT_216370 [Aspergillus pseudodeflectus]|uniref:Uncharacterized protein n=1 Tax=Aspergillus pseudodeflectus TaxID=176178 RepID=A0ABR4KTG9_9EURO